KLYFAPGESIVREIEFVTSLLCAPRQGHILEHLTGDAALSPDGFIGVSAHPEKLPIRRRCGIRWIAYVRVGKILRQPRIDKRDQCLLRPRLHHLFWGVRNHSCVLLGGGL